MKAKSGRVTTPPLEIQKRREEDVALLDPGRQILAPGAGR